jgi:ribosomal protein S18 acetylase RimI-like enzyme
MPHSPHPELRRARSSDAEALRELQDEIYREGSWFVGDGPPSVGALQRQLRGRDPRRSLVLVAVLGDGICAWLELHRLQPRRLEHVALLTLAVGRRHRRRGLGQALLERSVAWAQRVGVVKISLHVRSGNSAAIALYRSSGFVEEGRERHQVRGDQGFEDNLIMACFVDTVAGGPGRRG